MADVREMVTLWARGQEFANWTQVSLTRSLDSFPSAFSAALTHGQPGTVNPLGIATDDPIEILLGREVLFIGYAEEITESRKMGGRLTSVSGRSRAVDALCSCTGEPAEFLGGYIDSIATALAAPYGLAVDSQIVSLEPIPRFAPEPGETVASAIERLLRDSGAVLTDDAAGDIMLAVRGLTTAAPIDAAACKEIEVRCSSGERYSEYQVYGQSADAKSTTGGAAAHASATILDSAIERRKVLVIIADGQADIAACERRGVWEAVTRAGRSAVVSLTVQGWRDANGAVWAPNVLRRVEDADLGVWADLLVTEVTLTRGPGGTTASMTLMPPAAFETLAPEAVKAKTKGKGITRGFREWCKEDLAKAAKPGKEQAVFW